VSVPPDALRRHRSRRTSRRHRRVPRSIAGVRMALLFRHIANGRVKVSFRSMGEVDVAALAHQFGGGGHHRCCGRIDRRDDGRSGRTVLGAARIFLANGQSRERTRDQGRRRAGAGWITNPRHGRDLGDRWHGERHRRRRGGRGQLHVRAHTRGPRSLARQARKATEGVPGVTGVKIHVVDSADGGGQATARPPGRPAAAPPAPPTPDEMPGLGKVLAVSSGKGGVGKSTVSANLAAALARDGHRVGLMDADIYGPNIPRMFGVTVSPKSRAAKIQPLDAHGVKLMSLGFIVERDAPAIWRGPIIMKIITQFMHDVCVGRAGLFSPSTCRRGPASASSPSRRSCVSTAR